MSLQYAARIPTDASGAPMEGYPAAKRGLARYGTSAAVSSVITLTDDTSVVEVASLGGGGAVIRWVASNDTQASVIATGANSNFDNIIPANEVRRFVVPQETAGVTSIVGLNVKNGLFKRMALIGIGDPVSSVLVVEN